MDDGKSTLIGRLLYDTRSVYEDQLQAVQLSSAGKGLDSVDLSMLTDGLRAERAQGITIDVAYRYFNTPKRKFILADTPGHIQYTRNMVTGASTANLAIILIDARKGLVEQTYRHSFIASLLKIPHLIVCINKMDLVGYDQKVFEKIEEDYKAFSSKLEVHDIQFVPISALNGDNVVNQSKKMLWYGGSTLLHILENVLIESDHNHIDARFPIQYVIRPQTIEHQDFRGYAGQVAGGIFRLGDEVEIQPSGFTSKIKQIQVGDVLIEEAFAPMSVTMTLEDEFDVSRGDVIAKTGSKAVAKQELEMMVCWMSQRPLNVNGKYVVKHMAKEITGIVKEIQYKLNIGTGERLAGSTNLQMNDLGKVVMHLNEPLLLQTFDTDRNFGSLILIDIELDDTVAAGIVLR